MGASNRAGVLGRGLRSSAALRLLGAAVVEDGVLAVAKLALLEDALVELLEVVLGEAVVFEEALDLVVDVLGETGALVAVLDLEFVDEESLELLALLDVEQALAPGFGGLGFAGGGTI